MSFWRDSYSRPSLGALGKARYRRVTTSLHRRTSNMLLQGPLRSGATRSRSRPLKSSVGHHAPLREPRLEGFWVGGVSNKLKVRLRIRNLAALPVLAKS